jgi:16S rRNA (cytidine1402-2'-O)-methyltransferase
MSKGNLFLIPCSLGGEQIEQVIPSYIKEVINNCNHYIVENVRTARRFLIKAGIQTKIDDLTFFELNKHTEIQDLPNFLDPTKKGLNVGLLSEAGVPGVADPGADIVSIAHKNKIRVKPIVGPSSILLAIMASGLNGQNFCFNGYLPRDRQERKKAIQNLEVLSFRNQQTQIFIETPFRNNHMLEDLREVCNGETEIVVATNLTMDSERVIRMKAKDWKKSKIDLHKKPSVFLIHKY